VKVWIPACKGMRPNCSSCALRFTAQVPESCMRLPFALKTRSGPDDNPERTECSVCQTHTLTSAVRSVPVPQRSSRELHSSDKELPIGRDWRLKIDVQNPRNNLWTSPGRQPACGRMRVLAVAVIKSLMDPKDPGQPGHAARSACGVG
jgi:hypothetical protein